MDATLEKLERGKTEWRHWREVCRQLEVLGAVTQADLESSPHTLETPGQILLGTIREWGNSLVQVKQ